MGCFTCIFLWAAIGLIVIKLYIKLTTGWCRSNVCLVGKTVIITGANTGIGYTTAEDFAKRGARVILACRDPTRAKNAAERIISATDNKNVVFKQLDLSSFKSVREFADAVNKTEERLDILVNNAGAGTYRDAKSKDGLLLLMQTNYFGHFLLTNLLLDLIKKTPNARIVNVSSKVAKYARNFDVYNLNSYSHQFRTAETALYVRSKVCNILFTIELAERLKETSVPAMKYFTEYLLSLFNKDSLAGAQTSIYCSVAKGIELFSGQHFEDCRVVGRYKIAQNPDLPRELWKVSEYMVRLSQK